MANSQMLITTTADLNKRITEISSSPFVAVDTEFMRERTYYPQLCLIQLCDGNDAFCVDPLAPDIDLSALFSLMADTAVTKVFHAGRQDLEIFVHLTGSVPEPVYDTQIAAMVCGLGEQVGYDRLVHHYTGKQIDKSSRFTDWSHRPLSQRQLSYALDDVIYLAQIFPKMRDQLAAQNRESWVADELQGLSVKDLYQIDPATAWKRIKIRSSKAEQLNRLACLAAWRETEAQTRNVPRGRILRDDTLMDLAGSNPRTAADLRKIRAFPGGETGKFGPAVLAVLKQAAQQDKASWPVPDKSKKSERPPAALTELLRVLLKHIADEHAVAPRLIASADELEQLALSDTADIPALKGWRNEIFGQPARDLKAGKLALSVADGRLRLSRL